MPAVFTVQNDLGTVADANAYVDVAFFKQYHLDRGRPAAAALTDDKIQVGIVRATDYVDNRFDDRFAGSMLEDDQSTEWPRQDAYFDSGKAIEGIPLVLKRAISEYALRAATDELLRDPPDAIDGDGEIVATGKVTSLEQTVGPVSEKKTFEERYSSPWRSTGEVSGDLLPEIPAADILIEKLLVGGRQRKAVRS